MEVMPVPIFQCVRQILSSSGEYARFSYLFSHESATDDSRAALALTYMSEYGLMPFKRTDKLECMKSANVSIDIRNKGNKFFMKNNQEALLMYTRSIAAAPYPACDSEDSEELALAFANRSAVYFVLEKYEACLKDIEHALMFHYPGKLKYKLLERQAKCYQKLGRMDEACTSSQEAMEHISLAKCLPEDKMKSVMDGLKILQLGTGSTKCESWEVADTPKPLPQKSFGQHANISCAADCLEIDCNEEMGRHVIATRDIDPGDILMVEEPYASVLKPEYYSIYCYNCLKRSDAMIPCKVCDCAMYCSSECRESSWQRTHKVECRLVPALKKLDVGQKSLLLFPLRLFLIACHRNNGLNQLYNIVKTLENQDTGDGIKGFDQNGQYKSLDYTQIHNLFRNIMTESEKQLEWAVGAACIFNGLSAYSDLLTCECPSKPSEIPLKELSRFTAGLLLKYIEIINTNTYGVTERVTTVRTRYTENVSFATAIYSTLSLIGHSCNPNASGSFHRGDVHVIMANQIIRKGEEICISYGDIYASKEISERQQSLREGYFFDCTCEACVNNWPQYDDLRSVDTPVFICQKCRTPLWDIKLCSLTPIFTCITCNKKYNWLLLFADITKVLQRTEKIKEQITTGSQHNYVRELAGCVKIVDQIIQSPNQVNFTCHEALELSMKTTGNYVVEWT